MARSIVSMCFAYEIESVYVVHTERGETLCCIGARARVCRVAMKCSRTGCRRRVHRGPGGAVSFVGPVFTGHAGCGFFKDLPCYGSETGVRT